MSLIPFRHNIHESIATVSLFSMPATAKEPDYGVAMAPFSVIRGGGACITDEELGAKADICSADSILGSWLAGFADLDAVSARAPESLFVRIGSFHAIIRGPVLKATPHAGQIGRADPICRVPGICRQH